VSACKIELPHKKATGQRRPEAFAGVSAMVAVEEIT
jgi:hypothetical protein